MENSKNTGKTFKEKATLWMDNTLSPIMQKLASQRHLIAIRNGIVATIPFVIVGSMVLIVLNFPLDGDGKYLKDLMAPQVVNFFLAIYKYSMGAMGLYAAFGIAAHLGKSYGLGSIISGMMGVFAYLMWFDYATLTIDAFGGATIFNAMVSGILAVEIYKIFVKLKITLRMPPQVPGAIAESFQVLTPILFIGLLFGSFRYLLGFDLNNFLATTLAPLQNVLTGGFGGVVLIIVLVTFFWSFGIHGVSIVGSVVRPFWQAAIEANAEWFQGGMEGDVPYMFPEQFLQWAVWIGGSGATIGLVLVGVMMSKSKQGQAVSRTSFIPALFNINETAIFGYPIMLTPILMIPFMLAPLTMALIAWGMMVIFGDVFWVFVAPWTLPAPIGAFFAAGSNWKAIMIPLVTTIVSFFIYLPFYKKWDKDTFALELEAEKQEKMVKSKGGA